ncbi:putative repeat protein (TIGR03943 family) [Frigoribacterium sp. PhB107]|uniref:TIGR03943 family putative permease subunit n=1 Tax=Frigoribacterium sp. PhB107 TaxID=2485172 RepID=UPI000FAC80D5|nr:TIGR03943 family protein [Frigoribacterium sp. PhB107]ROP73020.1 putative repeat protein (TIGR03943 family) [Frigoribacterium sp. PhB107]
MPDSSPRDSTRAPGAARTPLRLDAVSRLADRWQGVLLTLVVGTSTLWLSATGQLVLYIHPRYVVFTVIMIAIGMVLSLGVLVLAPSSRDAGAEDDGHGHDGHHHDAHADELRAPAERPRRRRRGRAAARTAAVAGGALVTTAVAVSLVVLPPATLTSATAGQRDVNSSTASLAGTSVEDAASADADAYAAFSVLDWAGLLRQTSDLSFFEGKTADVVGFVVPAGDDPDVFYVSRFVVTCCAVDAQPVGVPVHLVDWRSQVSADEWLDVSGGFQTNPSRTSSDPIALVPDELEKVGQPSDPYLY